MIGLSRTASSPPGLSRSLAALLVLVSVLAAVNTAAAQDEEPLPPPEPAPKVERTTTSDGADRADRFDRTDQRSDSDPDGDVGADDESDGRKTWSLGLRAGVWFAELDGNLEVPRGLVSATNIDLRGDLDLNEIYALPFGELFVTTPLVQAYVDGFGFEDETSTTLDATIRFLGFEFTRGTPVEVEYSLRSLGARVAVTPIFLDFLEVGGVIGLRYFKLEGTIRGASAPFNRISASDEAEAPVPWVGGTIRVFIGALELYAWGGGMSLSYNYEGSTYNIRYFEGEAGFAFNFNDHVGLMVGYRGILLDLEEREENDGQPATGDQETLYRLSLTGPTVSLRLRF